LHLVFGKNTQAQLVNPNSTNEALILKTYLDSIYGKKILSGQMDDSYLSYIKTTTGGKEPAIMGYDFNGICPTQGGNNDAAKAIKWVKERGGIAQFNWHWISPDANGDYYTKNFNLANALADTTSSSYKNILRDIDLAAAEIKKMQDAGIAIIWRPLHEAEGKWFWWGMSGGAACKTLYRLMYDRFTNLHGLNNLIWAWTSYGTNKENWYPGDDVVDMIVWDYPDYSATGSWYQYQKLFGNKGKLFGIGEDGTLTNPDILTSQPWLYFLTWAYMVKDPSQKDGKNAKDWLMQVYNDPRVVTLEDLNAGPKAKAGFSETIYDLEGNGKEQLTLDASLSEADGDSIVAYTWFKDDIELGKGIKFDTELPYGTHKIKLSITTASGIQKSAWVIKTVRKASVSLNKAVNVSSTEAGLGNVPANAVDGDMSSRWSSSYSDPQWYQIDLGKPYDIESVVIHWQNASAKDYTLQQSNDGINWITVASRNNMKTGARIDSLNNLAGGAQFIRMHGTKRTTTWGYSIFEFEVYGKENSNAEPVEEIKTKIKTITTSLFKIYPTSIQLNNQLQVELASPKQSTIVSIFTLTGVLVKQITATENLLRIPIGNSFSKGVYLIHCSNNGHCQTSKFIVI